MDPRLKGLALDLNLLRKDLEQRKAARALPRERSPYSPSKTDRALKRSLSPTLQEVERLRRQAQSPRLRNWPGKLGEEGKGKAGLSGISLPNSRIELISQYQKTPWELPPQSPRPLPPRSPLDCHSQAAEMIGRSLKRHLITTFKHWKRQVGQAPPRRRYASSSRICASPTGTGRKGELGSSAPKSPAYSEHQSESSILRTAPRPLELSDLLLEPSAPRHITQPYKSTRFLPNSADSPPKLLVSSSARLLPSFTLLPKSYQPLTQMVATLQAAVREQTRGVLHRLGVWAVRSEAVGKLVSWLHRHITVSYQQVLYALLFVQKKQRLRATSRTGRRKLQPEKVKRLLQTCGPIVMAAIMSSQRDAFDAIIDAADHQSFHRSQYILHIPQLITVLQPLFCRQIQALLPLLRTHIKAKAKWQARVKLHLRACFRLFSTKRIKVLTRYISRYRGGVAYQKELQRKGEGLGEQLGRTVEKVLRGYWTRLGGGRELEKGDSLKVRRLLANVGKSVGFRVGAVFGLWARKCREKPLQSSFEANFLSSVFHSLTRSSLSPGFALLIQPPHSRPGRALGLFPLFLLLHVKVKAAQGLAFYRLRETGSIELSPKLRKAAGKSVFTLLETWTVRANREVWGRLRTCADMRTGEKREKGESQLSEPGKRVKNLIAGFSRVLRSTQKQALRKWHSQAFTLLEAALCLQAVLETCVATAQLWALSKLAISR